ncbi:MAG: hypothetical protein AB2799_19045 [Candidatus Thiodiazotropha sp.]
MANEVQDDRRKLSTFREKVLPTVVSAIVLAIAGGLVLIRDTVIQHDRDLRHVYVDGGYRSLRDAIHRLDSKDKELEKELQASNKRLDKITGY